MAFGNDFNKLGFWVSDVTDSLGFSILHKVKTV